jgi:phosphate transport system substrate-binding protein
MKMNTCFSIQLIVVFLAMALTVKPQRIKGSDTVLPIAQKEAEQYGKSSKSTVTISGGGSGVGLLALMEGTTDIAMSSFPMKFHEKMKFRKAGKTIIEKIIAYDALAVIVHPSNSVNALTRDQLEGVFTGKVKNWKELGGPDLLITCYSRETSSGTYEFFKEHVLLHKNYSKRTLNLPGAGLIVQSVSQTRGAIGYVGLAYLEKNVKALAVSFDGKSFVKPTVANAKNKSYPVTRPLYFFMDKRNELKYEQFISFVLSSEGQKIVSEIGFISAK